MNSALTETISKIHSAQSAAKSKDAKRKAQAKNDNAAAFKIIKELVKRDEEKDKRLRALERIVLKPKKRKR